MAEQEKCESAVPDWENQQRVSGVWRAVVLITLTGIVWTTTLGPAVAGAHEFEDDHVERSVAVVVRGDIGRIEYSIGLNPQTRKQLIEHWTGPVSKPPCTTAGISTDTDTGTDTDDPFLTLAAENVVRRLQVTLDDTLVPLELVSSSASARHHVDVTITVRFKIPFESISPATSPPIANVKNQPSERRATTGGSGGRSSVHLKLVDFNFWDARPDIVGTDLKRPMRSHVGSTVTFFPGFAPVGDVHLRPVPMGGGFRYACKAAGATVLTRSNVASILIRASRQIDANLSSDALAEAFKIEADLTMIK